MKTVGFKLSVWCLIALAGCAAPPPAAPPPSGLAELMEKPGERALIEGIRAYDDGQYPQAEAALRKALGSGLASARDKEIGRAHV